MSEEIRDEGKIEDIPPENGDENKEGTNDLTKKNRKKQQRKDDAAVNWSEKEKEFRTKWIGPSVNFQIRTWFEWPENGSKAKCLICENECGNTGQLLSAHYNKCSTKDNNKTIFENKYTSLKNDFPNFFSEHENKSKEKKDERDRQKKGSHIVDND